jgi:type II secretory pathway component PulM
MNLENFGPREQRIAAGGGILLLAALVVMLVGFASSDDYALAQQRLADARNRLARAEAVVRELRASQAGTAALEQMLRARGTGYSLYTSIDRAVRAAGLTDRARLESQAMGDASAVRITLQGVSMEELVDLLYDIYAGDKLVFLHRLAYLEPADGGRGLDCQFWLKTPRG